VLTSGLLANRVYSEPDAATVCLDSASSFHILHCMRWEWPCQGACRPGLPRLSVAQGSGPGPCQGRPNLKEKGRSSTREPSMRHGTRREAPQ
jgi:hypothetical protein